ncbi:MAG: hypothetical protein JSV84_13240 [Gemmatimonadota bacterium]|nr:MAG: hypothetical protein JSV84_13240 [Gemmatimonadota bacterium]
MTYGRHGLNSKGSSLLLFLLSKEKEAQRKASPKPSPRPSAKHGAVFYKLAFPAVRLRKRKKRLLHASDGLIGSGFRA